MLRRWYTVRELILLVFVVWLVTWVMAMRFFVMKSAARDAGRVADVTELTTALTAYYLDFNDYPTEWASEIDESLHLVPAYLLKLPKDPNQNSVIDDFANFIPKPGYYIYMPDRNLRLGTMIVMAKMETVNQANYIHKGSKLDPRKVVWTDIKDNICENGFDLDIESKNGLHGIWNQCIANDVNKLRFINVKSNEF